LHSLHQQKPEDSSSKMRRARPQFQVENAHSQSTDPYNRHPNSYNATTPQLPQKEIFRIPFPFVKHTNRSFDPSQKPSPR
jgi:hypothetical protein